MDTNLEYFERNFESEEIIFCEFEKGDTFYFIQSGEVRIVREQQGNENIIAVLSPGMFFGEMAIIENEPRSATAIAECDVMLFEFSRDNFEQVILDNFPLSLGLVKNFVDRIWVQQQRLKVYQYEITTQRLVALLLSLKEYQTIDAQNNQTQVNITVDNLAKWASVSLTDCKKGLQELSKTQLVQRQKSSIILNDIAGLERYLSLEINN